MSRIYLGQRYMADGRLAPNGYGYGGDAHVLTIGPTRSGKSRRLLIPNLAYDTSRSMLVVDVKGELAAITAEHRRKAGEVVILNPFGVLAHDPRYQMKTAGYNPLLSLDPGSLEFIDDATAIAEALITVAADSDEAHWAESAQDAVTGLVMFVRKFYGSQAGVFEPQTDWGYVRAPTLGEVRRLITLPPPRFATLAMRALRLADQLPAIANKLGAFFVLNDGKEHRELDSILSTARTQTRFLDSPSVAADLALDGISFRELKRRTVTVYLVLPPERLLTHAKWLRLVIDGAMRTMRTNEGANRPSVIFMLDEFPQLGRLGAVETAMALNAGYGVKIWAIVQHLGQLKQHYGENWETFLSGGVTTTFAPRDVFTAKHLSELAGSKTVDIASFSQSSAGISATVAPQKSEALRPDEFRSLRIGEQWVFEPSPEGQKVMKLYAEDFSKLPSITDDPLRKPARIVLQPNPYQ